MAPNDGKIYYVCGKRRYEYLLDSGVPDRFKEQVKRRCIDERRYEWRNSAPSSHHQMVATSKFIHKEELFHGTHTLAACTTDAEIMYLIEKVIVKQPYFSRRFYPPNSLRIQLDTYPPPTWNWNQASGEGTWAARAMYEEFILNESIPLYPRIHALYDRIDLLGDPIGQYFRFDLIEKGMAMLHELKFKIQGHEDWKRLYMLRNKLRDYRRNQTKDQADPVPYRIQFAYVPQFMKNQLMGHLTDHGYLMDKAFTELFGLESSEKVLRGEVEANGPYGADDWGKSVSPAKPLAAPPQVSSEDEQESTDADPQTEEDDEDSDGLEEITEDQFSSRVPSEEPSAAAERESSSEIEITGSNQRQVDESERDDPSAENADRMLISNGSADDEDEEVDMEIEEDDDEDEDQSEDLDEEGEEGGSSDADEAEEELDDEEDGGSDGEDGDMTLRPDAAQGPALESVCDSDESDILLQFPEPEDAIYVDRFGVRQNMDALYPDIQAAIHQQSPYYYQAPLFPSSGYVQSGQTAGEDHTDGDDGQVEWENDWAGPSDDEEAERTTFHRQQVDESLGPGDEEWEMLYGLKRPAEKEGLEQSRGAPLSEGSTGLAGEPPDPVDTIVESATGREDDEAAAEGI